MHILQTRLNKARKCNCYTQQGGYRSVVVIRNVPAEVCENCSEYFLSENTTSHVLSRAEEAVKKGAEVEILRYAA